MAYERFESAWDNFGKCIHQFQPETKTLIRKLERILIKLYRQVKLVTVFEGDPKAPFRQLLHQGLGEGATPFPGLL